MAKTLIKIPVAYILIRKCSWQPNSFWLNMYNVQIQVAIQEKDGVDHIPFKGPE